MICRWTFKAATKYGLGSVLKRLAKILLMKSLLMSLGSSAAASATDGAIHKKMFRSGFTTLTICNEEMNGIIKIVQSLKESSLWMKVVSEAIKNEAHKEKGGFLGMLLGTLGAT